MFNYWKRILSGLLQQSQTGLFENRACKLLTANPNVIIMVQKPETSPCITSKNYAFLPPKLIQFAGVKSCVPDEQMMLVGCVMISQEERDRYPIL